METVKAGLSILGTWVGLPITGGLLDGGQTWAGVIAGLASLVLIASGAITTYSEEDT